MRCRGVDEKLTLFNQFNAEATSVHNTRTKRSLKTI